jgi:hypothetical protein
MTLNFKNKEAFRRYNAFRFINGIPTKHKQKVLIAGKVHKVQHAKTYHVKRLHKLLDNYVM